MKIQQTKLPTKKLQTGDVAVLNLGQVQDVYSGNGDQVRVDTVKTHVSSLNVPLSHGTVGWDGQFTAFLDIYGGSCCTILSYFLFLLTASCFILLCVKSIF